MGTGEAVRGPAERGRWAPSRNACGGQSSCEPNPLEARNAAITAGRNRHEAGQRSAVVAQPRGAAASMRCRVVASQREGRAGRWLDCVEMGWCSRASPNNGMHRSAGREPLRRYHFYSPRPVMRVRWAPVRNAHPAQSSREVNGSGRVMPPSFRGEISARRGREAPSRRNTVGVASGTRNAVASQLAGHAGEWLDCVEVVSIRERRPTTACSGGHEASLSSFIVRPFVAPLMRVRWAPFRNAHPAQSSR
jgi:hypothetical protein